MNTGPTLATPNTKIKKESSFELLRIICMLFILNLHSFFLPSTHQISISSFLDFFRESTSISAVPIFVMISGYFGIKYSHKKLLSLLFNVFYWTFLVYIVCGLIGIVQPSIFDIIKRIYLLFLSYWFITSYIGLLILAPIINSWMEKVEKKELYTWILIFYIFAFICQIINHPDFRAGGSILSFIWLYIIGMTLKKYDFKNKIFKNNPIPKFIFCWIIVTLFITIQSYLSWYFLDLDKEKLNSFIFGFAYNSPLIIIQSLFVILIFSHFKFKSKIINYIGASTLAVYLLHMHPNLKELYYSYSQYLYSTSMDTQIISLIVLFFICFILSVLFDQIRIALWNLISK